MDDHDTTQCSCAQCACVSQAGSAARSLAHSLPVPVTCYLTNEVNARRSSRYRTSKLQHQQRYTSQHAFVETVMTEMNQKTKQSAVLM